MKSDLNVKLEEIHQTYLSRYHRNANIKLQTGTQLQKENQNQAQTKKVHPA